jgi:hypothetical protein
MRFRFMLSGLLALLSVSPGHSQAPLAEDLQFDILGIRLGQSMQDAVRLLQAHNPKMTIEIRRAEFSRWEYGCSYENQTKTDPKTGYIAWSCGNWADELEKSPHAVGQLDPTSRSQVQRTQALLDERNSLVAGIAASADGIAGASELAAAQVSGARESFTLVVTLNPGQERVIAISRVKAYAPGTAGVVDLYDQLLRKYGPVMARQATSEKMLPFRIVMIDGKTIGTADRRHSDCVERAGRFGTSLDVALSAPLPNRMDANCGTNFFADVQLEPANHRYAARLTLWLADTAALFDVTQARAAVVRQIRDEQFRTRAIVKEKF